MQAYMIQNKRAKLDGLLERAQKALCKLEGVFESVKDDLHNPEECYLDILTLYRRCRNLDRILKLSHTKNPVMRDLIDKVKDNLETERKRRLNKHLMKVFESRSVSKTDSGKVSSATQTENKATAECGIQCDAINSQTQTLIQSIVDENLKSSDEESCVKSKSESASESVEGAYSSQENLPQKHKHLCIQVCQFLQKCITKMQEEVAEKGAMVLDKHTTQSGEGAQAEAAVDKMSQVQEAIAMIKSDPSWDEMDKKLLDLLASDQDIADIIGVGKSVPVPDQTCDTPSPSVETDDPMLTFDDLDDDLDQSAESKENKSTGLPPSVLDLEESTKRLQEAISDSPASIESDHEDVSESQIEEITSSHGGRSCV